MQAASGFSRSLFHLRFNFQPSGKDYPDFFFRFYDHTLQDLPYYLIVKGQRMVLHPIEDGKNLFQTGGGVFSILFRGIVFSQLTFQRSFFSHQFRNPWIGEKLLLVFGSHAVQYLLELAVNFSDADLCFIAVKLFFLLGRYPAVCRYPLESRT